MGILGILGMKYIALSRTPLITVLKGYPDSVHQKRDKIISVHIFVQNGSYCLFMQNLGKCYPPLPLASADNTLLVQHNSPYHTQPHPIIILLSITILKIKEYYCSLS